MAKKTYTLQQEAIDRQADFVADMQAGDEFEHDFGESETAVIAAGWVEPAEEPKKKGGNK